MNNILMHEMLWHLVSLDPTREIMEDDSTICCTTMNEGISDHKSFNKR
jgi:hypothetical protein